MQSDRKYEVLEVGIQNPEEVIVDELGVGQVGSVERPSGVAELIIRYVVCNMKHSEDGKLTTSDRVIADLQLLSVTQSVIPTLWLSHYLDSSL